MGQKSRPSENPATSTCVTSDKLVLAVANQMKNHANGVRANNEGALVAAESTMQCPPFCGGDGSMVPRTDDGSWGDEQANAQLLSGPGEDGLKLDPVLNESDEMKKERERWDILHEAEILKELLAAIFSSEEGGNLDIAAKLKVMDRLEELIKIAQYKTDGSIAVAPELLGDIDTLKSLADGLVALRHQLGDDDTLDVGDAAERLNRLITLLLSYLSPIYAKDSSQLMYIYSRARKEINSVFDKIKKAREQAKCQRINPDDPVKPGCETTQMALSNMPLRDTEQDDNDKIDPVLQKEFGATLKIPSGIEVVVDQDPPLSSIPESGEGQQAHGGNFWMPEACEGEGCNRQVEE